MQTFTYSVQTFTYSVQTFTYSVQTFTYSVQTFTYSVQTFTYIIKLVQIVRKYFFVYVLAVKNFSKTLSGCFVSSWESLFSKVALLRMFLGNHTAASACARSRGVGAGLPQIGYIWGRPISRMGCVSHIYYKGSSRYRCIGCGETCLHQTTAFVVIFQMQQ